MANTLNQLVMPIYNVGLGVDARLVGIALGALRLLDAFTDPFMGNLSDNTRSRWGRRRPYIFAGAILGAVLYAMIWMPPASLGETGLFVYLLVVSTLFFVAYTIFSIPFGALVFEMTPDTHERTRIISCRTFFLGAALIAIPWL
jgi:GPH family glycoside/pentoside/hexuronide:cation symporter